MLLEYSAQLVDVDKGFGAVCLGASQTSSQGVPELHRWQIVGAGLRMLGLEKGQNLGAVLRESWAVLHKLGGRRREHSNKTRFRFSSSLYCQQQQQKTLRTLTSANSFSFSACRTCAFFLAEAKGDSVMWVVTGCWALSGDTFFWSWADEVEAEQEGWGLSSSSSSRTMILSAITAGATAIPNVDYFCFSENTNRENIDQAQYQVGSWTLDVSHESCNMRS